MFSNARNAFWRAFYRIVAVPLFVLALAGLIALWANVSELDGQLKGLSRQLTEARGLADQANSRADALEAAKKSADGRLAAVESALAASIAAQDTTKSSLARLQGTVAWRDVPADMRAAIVASLSKANGGSIDVVALDGDAEARYFAGRISAMFKDAGWSVRYASSAFPGEKVMGVALQKADNPQTAAVASAFQENGFPLAEAGAPATGESADAQRAPVTLIVGARPTN